MLSVGETKRPSAQVSQGSLVSASAALCSASLSQDIMNLLPAPSEEQSGALCLKDCDSCFSEREKGQIQNYGPVKGRQGNRLTFMLA